MDWYEAVAGCKKHSRRQQEAGVCSYCLRERLSELAVSSSRNNPSSAPSLSSSSASSSSPTHDRPPQIMRKSRSVALAVRKRVREDWGGVGTWRKKGGRFWSRLLRSFHGL